VLANEQLLVTAHAAVCGSPISFANRIVVRAPQQNGGHKATTDIIIWAS
jgi:hypothetical protein